MSHLTALGHGCTRKDAPLLSKPNIAKATNNRYLALLVTAGSTSFTASIRQAYQKRSRYFLTRYEVVHVVLVVCIVAPELLRESVRTYQSTGLA